MVTKIVVEDAGGYKRLEYHLLREEAGDYDS